MTQETIYKKDRLSRFAKAEEYFEDIMESEEQRCDRPFETVESVVEAYGLVVELYERLDHIKKQAGKLMNRYKVGIVPEVLLNGHGQTKGEAGDFCKTNILDGYSVKTLDKEALIEFLRDTGRDDNITVTVSASTLGSMAKDANDPAGTGDCDFMLELEEQGVIQISNIKTARLERKKSFIKS